MLGLLHLVRHGEVHNPDHICYGYLPGFALSEVGSDQALAAAAHLATARADLLLSSPLQRAMETAAIIGRELRLNPVPDDRLLEWELAERWGGVVWERLPEAFPGELEAYLERPHDLAFAPRSIARVAARVAALVHELGTRHPGAAAVLVSHQDPLQAARLSLTGGSLAHLHRGKPGHCAVITLAPGSPWRTLSAWEPGLRSPPFPPIAAR